MNNTTDTPETDAVLKECRPPMHPESAFTRMLVQACKLERERDGLLELVKNWWEDHKFDTCGDYGAYNVFDDEPPFVTKAKELIGDWETETN